MGRGRALTGLVRLRDPDRSSDSSGSGPNAHYRQAALDDPGRRRTAPTKQRADRQVRQVVDFLPRYHGSRRSRAGRAGRARGLRCADVAACPFWIQPALIGLTLFDLAVLGFGLNPAIPAVIHAFEPPVIARLRQGAAARWPGPRAGRRAAAQRPHAVRPFRHPQLRLGRAGLQPRRGSHRSMNRLRRQSVEPKRDHLERSDRARAIG